MEDVYSLEEYYDDLSFMLHKVCFIDVVNEVVDHTASFRLSIERKIGNNRRIAYELQNFFHHLLTMEIIDHMEGMFWEYIYDAVLDDIITKDKDLTCHLK